MHKIDTMNNTRTYLLFTILALMVTVPLMFTSCKKGNSMAQVQWHLEFHADSATVVYQRNSTEPDTTNVVGIHEIIVPTVFDSITLKLSGNSTMYVLIKRGNNHINEINKLAGETKIITFNTY